MACYSKCHYDGDMPFDDVVNSDVVPLPTIVLTVAAVTSATDYL